jgi:hypothetical protein
LGEGRIFGFAREEREQDLARLGVLAMKLARLRNGVEEIPRGSNWGPNVKEYLSRVGITFPTFWCMAFVVTMMQNAAQLNQMANPFPVSGSCTTVGKWAKKQKVLFDVPEVGDVFLVKSRVPGVYLHTGFVVWVNEADGTFGTIEGNSNKTRSHEGYMVCENVRSVRTCRFVRV